MSACATCGYNTKEPLSISYHTINANFCCFECAISALAPACPHCQCRVVGHGVYGPIGEIFCCDHCRDQSAEATGNTEEQEKVLQANSA